jgi:phosphoribosylamine--glycine ligase
MGTITDDSLLTRSELDHIADTIIRPTLAGCIAEGFPFRGVLFLGLMMTPDGPKLLEYNVRFGDPETQAILIRLETDIVEICEAMLNGTLGRLEVNWRPGSSACVVLAASGYPSKPNTGAIINGLAEAGGMPGIEIFHAGTAKDESGNYVTAGGRVLGITAAGPDLSTSLSKVYSAVDLIDWQGIQFRRDIGAVAAGTV